MPMSNPTAFGHCDECQLWCDYSTVFPQLAITVMPTTEDFQSFADACILFLRILHPGFKIFGERLVANTGSSVCIDLSYSLHLSGGMHTDI